MTSRGASAACDALSYAACHDVCLDLGDTIECDLTRNNDEDDASGTGQITAVYANDGFCDDGSDEVYCAWGGDGHGNSFCCAFQAADEKTFVIHGTENADTINLFYSCESEYDMDNWGWDPIFTGTVYGRGGIDTITGSRSVATDYKDQLHGDGGDDDIAGQAGADDITGDADGDTLDGGPGADTIHGNGGSDTILGGDDADNISGGDNQDNIAGGGGADTINGDNQADTICGDAGNDDLRGNGDNDVLYGGLDTDISDGGIGSADACHGDFGETLLNCEGSVSSRPMACP